MILVKTCLFEKRRKVNKKREAKDFEKTMNSPGFRRILERLGTQPFEIRGKKKTPLQKVERGYPKNRLHLLFNEANKDDNCKTNVAQ